MCICIDDTYGLEVLSGEDRDILFTNKYLKSENLFNVVKIGFLWFYFIYLASLFSTFRQKFEK